MHKRIWFSWKLVRASVALLHNEPNLLIFPIISIIVTLLVLATFAVALLASVGFDMAVLMERSLMSNVFVLFAFYLVAYFVIFYVNTGLTGAVILLLDGEKPGIGDSFRIARERTAAIFGYAFIMATVGMVLRWLFRLIGPPGRLFGPILHRTLIFTIIGLAWHLIPYLVVPILVVENVGPHKAFVRSTNLLKKTWGENVVGNASTGVIFMLLVLLIAATSARGVQWAVFTGNQWLIIGVLYVFVMVLLTLFLIKMALDGIFCAVVYRFAVGQPLGDCFDSDVVEHAFRTKRRWHKTRQSIPADYELHEVKQE